MLNGEGQQRFQRADRLVHALPRIADLGEPGRHRVDGERLRLAASNLGPGQRRGHPRVAGGADRIRRRHRAVLGVLVVVNEHAMQLLLPPLRGGQLGRPPLDLPGQRHGGAADLGETPVPLDSRVDVEAPGAGGLRPPGQPEVGEHITGDEGHLEDLRPLNAGHRVQVDPQLVRVVEVFGQHRVRVQVDAAQVDHPGDAGHVAGHHLVGGAPGREAEQDRLDPVGPLVRGPLLEERLALGAVHVPLEHHGPPGHAAQRSVRHGEVVLDQVELGVPGAGEVDLARVRHHHGGSPHVQAQFLPVRHASTVTRRSSGRPDDDRGVSGKRLAWGEAPARLLDLYDQALPQVYGYLLSRCGQRALAEDLAAETFLAAVDAVRVAPSPPLTTGWLIGVARHKLSDHWRRQAREERTLRAVAVAAEPDLNAGDPWDARLDALRAQDVLQRLGPHHRAALTLRYVDDLPVPEVASLLGRTVHATEALLGRARTAFRRAYQDDLGEGRH